MSQDRSYRLATAAGAISDDVIARCQIHRRDPSSSLPATSDERATNANCRTDSLTQLSFLAEAVRRNEPALFEDYLSWARSASSARGVCGERMREKLRLLQGALYRHIPAADAAVAAAIIDTSLDRWSLPSNQPPTFLVPGAPNVLLARQYLESLLRADRKGAIDLIRHALHEGMPLKSIYLDVFQQSQRELGRLWQLNKVTVAQEHYCTAATQAIMNRFFNEVLETPRIGRSVLAFCVEGDLHEIGVRIVADFFELAGWDCDFLGANTPSAMLVDSLATSPFDLIAISATMTYHVAQIEAFIVALRARTDIPRIPVLVGGGPFLADENLWQRIGADGWATDAASAVRKGTELVEAR
jgi:methanogenic corrinoid protein MtbC1